MFYVDGKEIFGESLSTMTENCHLSKVLLIATSITQPDNFSSGLLGKPSLKKECNKCNPSKVPFFLLPFFLRMAFLKYLVYRQPQSWVIIFFRLIRLRWEKFKLFEGFSELFSIQVYTFYSLRRYMYISKFLDWFVNFVNKYL